MFDEDRIEPARDAPLIAMVALADLSFCSRKVQRAAPLARASGSG